MIERVERRILAGPDGPRLVRRPDGLVDLVGLDPHRLIADARSASAPFLRRGRPSTAHGELTAAEIRETIAIRRRRGLKVTHLQIAVDLGISPRTLRRAISELGLFWPHLAAFRPPTGRS